jgi:hypothetical protein
MDATRARRSTARRIARSRSPGMDWSRSAMPGTITVSARLNDESRHGTLNVTCSDFTSGASCNPNVVHRPGSAARRPFLGSVRPLARGSRPVTHRRLLSLTAHRCDRETVEVTPIDPMLRPSTRRRLRSARRLQSGQPASHRLSAPLLSRPGTPPWSEWTGCGTDHPAHPTARY